MVGGGLRRRSMAVIVMVNGARWWSMEKREGKKTIAANKVAQKK